jgi:hypothetical protein
MRGWLRLHRLRDSPFVQVTVGGGGKQRRLIETADAGRSRRVVHVWP